MLLLVGTGGTVPHLLPGEDRGQGTHLVSTVVHLGRCTGGHITVWVLTTAWAQPPAVFAIVAHGGRCCGVIYLFAEAPAGEGHPARMHFWGCRWQPQAACTSSESMELHAAKTRLGTGTPEQQSAQKCPDHGHWLLDQG